MKEYGLDLSKHNGSLDFNAIKNNGNTFVILRAGYGVSGTKDPKFDEYYAAAKSAGLKVGAYWYSYALNADHAKTEAKNMLEIIKGKTFEYPVFIDMEDADGYKKKNGMPSNSTLASICNVFCEYIESKDYYVGIYASESWFNNQLKTVSSAYDKWVANWGTNNGTLQSDKSNAYKLHQFTSNYSLNGKRFDRNISYHDYETTIKNAKLNGFGETSTQTPVNTPSGSTLDLVAGVMQKKYGDGEARKAALGTRYDEVQSIINHIANASIDTLVNEVKAGKYGNNPIRKTVLGSRYQEVQDKINNEDKSSIKEGQSVRIKNGAKDLNTKTKYASWVYKLSFKVIQVKQNRVVFGNSKNEIIGATDISNCY
ncbi:MULTISPECIES: GH25 family lysozyme [Erysipelotrichales]|uniref:Cpl-7 lysozyme C-terminal domain-containing protein n=1 Tax=Massilimicrobiota timonensis TaxID=1776392 RepID=A0A1Y4STN4_9FIRM|nr:MULTISPECIES: GH25 family lysozyme [Erysipelotrichales]OUQ33266.1 hypothetical protein B5E75_11035 [Massilimicrobiota timonensis]